MFTFTFSEHIFFLPKCIYYPAMHLRELEYTLPAAAEPHRRVVRTPSHFLSHVRPSSSHTPPLPAVLRSHNVRHEQP